MKPCSKCGEVKPREAFGADKSMASGRRSDCRVCRRSQQKTARLQEMTREPPPPRPDRYTGPNVARRIASIAEVFRWDAAYDPEYLGNGKRGELIRAAVLDLDRIGERTCNPKGIVEIAGLLGCSQSAAYNARHLNASQDLTTR